MQTFRARVKGGRLVLDEPTALPEGTVIPLAIADEDDDLDEAERAALHAALDAALARMKSGVGRPAADVIRDLRANR